MKIDLACVSLDTILLTKDYFEAEYGELVTLRHIEGGVEVVCKDERGEQFFWMSCTTSSSAKPSSSARKPLRKLLSDAPFTGWRKDVIEFERKI